MYSVNIHPSRLVHLPARCYLFLDLCLIPHPLLRFYHLMLCWSLHLDKDSIGCFSLLLNWASCKRLALLSDVVRNLLRMNCILHEVCSPDHAWEDIQLGFWRRDLNFGLDTCDSILQIGVLVLSPCSCFQACHIYHTFVFQLLWPSYRGYICLHLLDPTMPHTFKS